MIFHDKFHDKFISYLFFYTNNNFYFLYQCYNKKKKLSYSLYILFIETKFKYNLFKNPSTAVSQNGHIFQRDRVVFVTYRPQYSLFDYQDDNTGFTLFNRYIKSQGQLDECVTTM